MKIGEYLTEREISLNILKEKMRFFNDDLVRLATIFVEMVSSQNIINLKHFLD